MAGTPAAWQERVMSGTSGAADGKRDRAIPAWRLAAGAFLHFAVPAYAITVPVACLLTAPAGASIADLARIAMPASGWFLAGYAGLGALAVAAAASAAAFTSASLIACSSKRLRQAPTSDPS